MRAPLRRRLLAGLAILAAAGIAACRIHDISAADSTIAGVYTAGWQASSGDFWFVTIYLDTIDATTLSGRGEVEVGGRRTSSVLHGTLTDSAVFFYLPQGGFSFSGVWRPPRKIVGDAGTALSEVTLTKVDQYRDGS